MKKETGYVYPKDPARKLLQKDLRELCDEGGIEYGKYDKNIDLQTKLVNAGILEKQNAINVVYYDFEKSKEILDSFIEVYKRIVTRLGIIALYNVDYKELPNPFDTMNYKPPHFISFFRVSDDMPRSMQNLRKL